MEFFDYKDAYTGLPMETETKDHVIPIKSLGGTVRQNIIPCDLRINSSKHNYHMLEWYKSQPFFSQERLDRIFEWMGKYKEHLFDNKIKATTPRFNKSSTLYCHRIPLPNNTTKTVWFPYHSNPKKRTFMIQGAVLDDWEDYCNDNWIIFNGKNYYNNPEDKVKRFLDNCATYLTIKHKDNKKAEYKCLEVDDFDKINSNEMHLDSFINDDYDVDIDDTIELMNEYHKNKYLNDGVMLYPKEEREKQARQDKRRQPTKFDKYEMIFGCDEKMVTKYKNKNKPFFPDYWIVEDVKIDKRDGLIDKNKDYASEWCRVNVDGSFVFNDTQFIISDSVNEYRENGHTKRYDTYRDDYSMDKVLVFEQFGNLYFFNQEIDLINNDYIYIDKL